MDTQEKIGAIMTANVLCIDIEDDLLHVNNLMMKHNIRHLPVLSSGKLVGIISQTDILRLSFGWIFEGQEESDLGMFESLRVDHVMASNPKVVNISDTVVDVGRVFTESNFHAVPVVNEEQELVGIVSTTDIIRYFIGGNK